MYTFKKTRKFIKMGEPKERRNSEGEESKKHCSTERKEI